MPIFYTNTASIDNLLITGSGVSMLGTMIGSFSGSFTGSFLGTIATASYITGSAFDSTNPVMSASYALTASYALNAAGTSTTINNNADNRLITGDNTANTLNAESNLTFDGSTFTLSSTATQVNTPIMVLSGSSVSQGMIVRTTGRAQYTARSSNFTDRELRFQAFSDGNTYFALQGLSGTVTGSLIIRTSEDSGTNDGSIILATRSTQRMRFGPTGIKVGAESTLPNANAILDVSGSTIISGSLIVAPSSVREFEVTSTGLNIGNVITDVHTVTGSLRVSGSIIGTASYATYALTAGVAGSGTTFAAGNVDNRIVTATGNTPGELNGEANLSFDSSNTLRVTGSLIVAPSSAKEFEVTSAGVNIGNISTDVHRVTGSLQVSGSIRGNLNGFVTQATGFVHTFGLGSTPVTINNTSVTIDDILITVSLTAAKTLNAIGNFTVTVTLRDAFNVAFQAIDFTVSQLAGANGVTIPYSRTVPVINVPDVRSFVITTSTLNCNLIDGVVILQYFPNYI